MAKTTKKDLMDTSIEYASDAANEIAQGAGYEDAGAMFDSIKADLNGNAASKNRGLQRARDFTKDLTLLVLEFETSNPDIGSDALKIANMFDDGMISEGNAKRYTKTLFTGSEVYDVTKFIPETATEPAANTTYIKMRDEQGNLMNSQDNKSYQFKKTLTLKQNEWLVYFTSGGLRDFIIAIVKDMKAAATLYKYDFISKFIKAMAPAKSITGTATNMFDALSDEVFPEIETMLQLNSEYCYSQDEGIKVLSAAQRENLVMIVPLKLRSALRTGVQSQLFNAELIELSQIIKPENIISFSNELNISTDNSGTVITDTQATPYLDNNTILVFDKRLLRHLLEVSFNGEQAYDNNMTLQITMHQWGTLGLIKWYKAFKYTNTNLLTRPGQGN